MLYPAARLLSKKEAALRYARDDLDALLHGLALEPLPPRAEAAKKNIWSTPLFAIKDIGEDLQL